LEAQLEAERKENAELAAKHVQVQRCEDDIQRIYELEDESRRWKEESNRLKSELIEARAKKSASEDDLATANGKVETLENTVASAAQEGWQCLNQSISNERSHYPLTFKNINILSL